MAGGVLGRLQYLVGVDSGGVDRGVAEVEAKVKGAMATIDHMQATAEIRAELGGLDKDIADARAKLLRLDAERADPEVDIDDDSFNAEYAAIQTKLKLLKASRIEIGVRYKQIGEANRELQNMEKALNAVTVAEQNMARVGEANRLQTLKNRSELERLRQSYVKLRGEQKTAERATNIFGRRTDENRQILRRTSAEMALTGERIRQLGGNLTHMDAEAQRSGNAMSRWARKIGGARVNIGPFSLKLGSFIPVLGVLSSLIVDVGGGIVALAGSLAQAAAGGLAIGSAAFAGLALSAAGVAFAVKPLLTDFKAASTASKALTTAQLKYGKSSDEAKTASQQLDQTLKGMPPKAAEVVRGWTALKTAFLQRTGGIRDSFIGDMQAGLTTLETLMPSFARNSTQAFQAASAGWHDWMQGLRSDEAQNLMDNIMGNFTRALPSLMHGLGQFATAIARITSAGSDFLGEFTRGFDQVGTEFADSTSNADRLHNSMGNLVDQTHSWFNLLGATGRLLVTVLTGGSRSGKRMVDDLTESLNGWNRALQTASGQQGMTDFFSEAVDTTEAFASALAKLGVILFDVSRFMEPITTGALALASVLGDIGHFVAGIKPLKPIIEGVGAALAGLFVANKIKGFAVALFGAESAFAALATRLGFTTAAQTAEAGAAARAGVAMQGEALAAGELTGALTGLNAAQVRSAGGSMLRTGALPAELAASSRATTGFGVAASSLVAPLAVAAAGIGAFALANHRFNTRADETDAALQKLHSHARPINMDDWQPIIDEAEALDRAERATRDLVQAHQHMQAAARQAKDEEHALQQAIQAHGRNSIQAAVAQDRLSRSTNKWLSDNHQALNKAGEAERNYTDAVKNAREGLRSAESTARAYNRTSQATARGRVSDTEKARQQAQVDAELAARQYELRSALDARAVGLVNIQRATDGVRQITGNAARSVGAFARAFKGIPQVQKFLVQTNSRQAVKQVSQVGNQLSQLGGKKAVVDIIANSKSPEQAFRRLSAAVAALQRADPILNIEQRGAEGVLGILSKLTGVKLTDKTQNVKESGGDGVLNTLQRITGVRIPDKLFSVRANDNASGTISNIRGALAGLSDKTVNIYTVHHQARAEGGPLIGAAAQGAKISKPTYLTGEEAPQHPEWVIASNPAYARSNRVYLQEAAGALGYAVVPMSGAFREGGPLKPGTKGGAPDPNPRGSDYDRLHAALIALSGRYDTDRRRYDLDKDAGRKSPITLDILMGEKAREVATEKELRDVIARMLANSKGDIKHDDKQEKQLHHLIKHKEKQLHKMGKRPKRSHYGKGNEGQRSYDKATNNWEHRHDELQQGIDKAKSKLNAVKQKEKATKQAYPALYDEWLNEVPNDIQNLLLDIQALKDEKAGVGGTAATDPSLDQTASGKERYNALLQYGGNFRGVGFDANSPTSRFTGAKQRTGPGHAVLSPDARAFAPPSMVKGASGAASAGASAPSVQNKNVTVNNYYRRGPRDTHTWSAGLRHELGALLS